MSIILIFLCSIILLTILIRAGLTIMGKMAGRHVHDRHQILEYILNTGSVPPQWAKAIESRPLTFSTPSKYKKRAIQRLDHLIKEMKHSPLVDGEMTRMYLLEELDKVRTRWQTDTWGEITDGTDEKATNGTD